MSLHLSELCALIVEEVYGELTSLLLRILFRNGRLSLPAIKHQTCLSDRLIKHGLSVLIQQRLVLWYTTENNFTTFEANPEAAYSLVRAGKYVKIIEHRFGKLAGDVVSNISALGHARVGDLLQAYGVHNENRVQEPQDFSNAWDKSKLIDMKQEADVTKDDGLTSDKIRAILHELLSLGLISRVHISHFRSNSDNRIEAEKVVPPVEHYKAKSKRENEAQWEATVNRKLAEWKHGIEDEVNEVNSMQEIQKGKKRMRESTTTPRSKKKQRLDPTMSHQNDNVYEFQTEMSGSVDDNTTLQIDHVKFAVLMRNEDLIQLAEELICPVTSKVYSQVLRAFEPKMRMCKSEIDTSNGYEDNQDLSSLPQITTDELVMKIGDTLELANALGKIDAFAPKVAQDEHPKKRRKKELTDKDEVMINGDASPNNSDRSYDSDFESESDDSMVSIDSDDINSDGEYKPGLVSQTPKDPHREAIREHLQLLAKHPHKFLHRLPQTHILPERWTVHYPSLIKSVTRHSVLRTIGSRYGTTARRIAHLLSEAGKVSEADLTEACMMGQKPIRNYLSRLYLAGMLQLLEVPRDATRNPQRSLYLWYFDLERCKSKMLGETYKTMARCLQRVKVEAAKVKSTVEKANRTDVVGREEEFLSIQEREALAKWRATEDEIWGEIKRMDDLMCIIRDY